MKWCLIDTPVLCCYWHACDNTNAFHSQEEEACGKNDGHRGAALCRLLGAFPSGLPPAWLRYHKTPCALPSWLLLSISLLFSSPHKKYIFLSVSQPLSFLLEYSKNILTSDPHLLFHFPPPQPFIEVNTRPCEPSTCNRLFFYSSHSYPYGNYCEFVVVL